MRDTKGYDQALWFLQVVNNCGVLLRSISNLVMSWFDRHEKASYQSDMTIVFPFLTDWDKS